MSKHLIYMNILAYIFHNKEDMHNLPVVDTLLNSPIELLMSQV